MKRKILVTGSNGLLGQKIVLGLRGRADIELVATSKGENRLSWNDSYHYEPLDVTDHGKVAELIRRTLPEAIIHTAAMTHVDACEKEKGTCWNLNVNAVGNLVRICHQYKIHLLHLSTDFVFDGKKGPYKEEASPAPLAYYAESKLASEQFLMASKIRWTILRTILLYGVAQNMKRSNIVLWIKESLEMGKSISIVTDQVRSPTLAEDLASACISAALKGATGIYHVSGKDTMSIFEMAKTIADFFGLDSSLIQPTTADKLNQPAKRPAVTGFILDKAIRDLDYQPHSFTEGLQLVKKQLKQLKHLA